jgi:MraZ protein
VFFTGAYEHTLDSKGRLILPAKFRDQLQGGGWLSQPTAKCLALFSRDVFEQVAAMHRERQRSGDQAAADQARAFFARSFEVIPDAQGRIPVPQLLRDKVGIVGRDVTVIGNNSRIEIWDRAAWAHEDANQDNLLSEQSQGQDISF